MDSKGRVSIPAEFRRALEANDPDWSEGDNPRMYIHYGENLKGGLEVYTVKAQEEIEDIVLDMDYGPERELSEDYFLTSTQEVKLDDTGSAVARVLAEKQAGNHDDGSIDLIWINGENFAAMRESDLLFGPFAEALPNFALTNAADNPEVVTDFTLPTEGFESPWGKAQITFYYDSAQTESPPQDMPALLTWARANPG